MIHEYSYISIHLNAPHKILKPIFTLLNIDGSIKRFYKAYNSKGCGKYSSFFLWDIAFLI